MVLEFSSTKSCSEKWPQSPMGRDFRRWDWGKNL